jgi:hypothetical protein
MRRLAIVMTAPAALLVLLAFASTAFAESPWWHLTSGARPAYLHAGAGTPGVNEKQKITVNAAGGKYVLANMTKLEIEEGHFECENAKGEGEPEYAEVPFNATVEEVQEGLEHICGYGKGNVEVSGTSSEYEITFRGSLAEQSVRLVNTEIAGEPVPLEGTVSASETVAGHAGLPDGEIFVTANNLGDANVDPSKTLVQFKDVLPEGLKAIAISGTQPRGADIKNRDPLSCMLATLTCTLPKPLPPYGQLEMRIGVDVEPGAESSPQVNEAFISGGGAPGSSTRQPVTISTAPVPFGIEDYEMSLEEEGGGPAVQAGTHPFQMTTTIDFNQLGDLNPVLNPPLFRPESTTPALTKDVNVKLPPGLIGNPTPIPRCTVAQFTESIKGQENGCPANSAVGVATVIVHEPATFGTLTFTEPVFNLEPRVGEPARFGFDVVPANAPVYIDTSVGTGSDYAVTAKVENVTQTAAFLSSEVTFWGVPGDSRHDNQRGWGCLYVARGQETGQPCTPAAQQHPAPFLSMPTRCNAPLGTTIAFDSWDEPGAVHTVNGLFQPSEALSGCNRVQFQPEIKIAPDGEEASKPTGLTVDVHVPQEVNNNAAGLASSNVEDISVTFPEGVVLNPAAADGLQACPESLASFEGFKELEPGVQSPIFPPALPDPLQQGVNFCPDGAKVGTVSIKSPLLPAGQPVVGSLYLATPAPNEEPGKNPFNTLVAMYIIARDPISGFVAKLPGRVTLDQATGRITATFEDNPQLAFEDAEIHLFGGERAPLATPSHCGAYTTEATFTPWSATPPVKSTSSFNITSGPNGTPCPSAALPFGPSLAAGTTNINAGSFSPLTTTISRDDGQQDIQAVALNMPPGLSAILTGVRLCPEAQANAGTCPQNSLIGHTIVSVGLGGDPFSVSGGQVFLTEKYEGAPFGLSIVNPAVAGPFDLGKVIVRAKVQVDPHTAALTVTTNPSGPFAIPHILDGIPLQIKHVNVLIDRPGFTFNPTNCAPQRIAGSITSDHGAQAPVATPFQATNCANLKFSPDFKASTAAKTSKANGASLKVRLSYPSAPVGTYANVAKVKVSLPKQLPSRLTTLQKACTSATFDQNPAGCPNESIVGQAKVITPLLPVPLTGPAYFVSHGGEAFPDLTIVLQGYGVTVDLVGSTQIKNGITTSTLKATPDVPFSSFELTLPQGKFSALAANANLCKSNLVMPSEFQAQNGAELKQQTKIQVTGCPKAHLTRKAKLAKALKVCHKKKGQRRKSCERQARRRFGVKAQKNRSKPAGKR